MGAGHESAGGAMGYALHAISCAAGYNLRWLLRAVAHPGIGPAFLYLLQTVLSAAKELRALQDTRGHTPAIA